MLLKASSTGRVLTDVLSGGGVCKPHLSEATSRFATSHPDVLLLDIAMRGLNGLDTAVRVATECPTVKVIILSMHANEEYVLQALRAGVAGYLLKDAAAAELDLALGAVGRGETYLSPSISRTVIDGYLARASGSAGKGAETLGINKRHCWKC